MTADQWPAILVAVGAIFTGLGAGTKWLFSMVEKRIDAAAKAEADAREELSARLNEEIRLLRIELATSLREKSLYLRRIYQLESFIHKQPGIDLPDMAGWPP